MTTPDTMPQRDSNAELLTVDQLAERLQLSRATIFAWVQRGILVQGQHFLKYGRVVRFLWSDNMLESLLIESVNKDCRLMTKSASHTPRQTNPGPVNWEY